MNELSKEVESRNALLTIEEDSEFPISGRELHERLNIGTAYKDWFPRMCEYGFQEGKDFCSKMSESTGGRPATNHMLSMDMAKHIAMIQRSDEAMAIRQYLIDTEKAWNSPEQIMSRALKIADRTIARLHEKVTSLENEKQVLLPKSDYTDIVLNTHDAIPIKLIAKDFGWTAQKLNNFLRNLKIQHKDGKMWILNEPYDDKGYTESETVVFGKAGNEHSTMYTKWTQKGRRFIYELMKEHGYSIKPGCELNYTAPEIKEEE